MDEVIRVEQIVRDGTGFHYYIMIDRPEGQYRGTLDFDHEPRKDELDVEKDKWRAKVRYITM